MHLPRLEGSTFPVQDTHDRYPVLHLFRKCQPAFNRFNYRQTCWVTSITWLEEMEEASSKVNHTPSTTLLGQFETHCKHGGVCRRHALMAKRPNLAHSRGAWNPRV
jgi:hypothetical protein